MTLKESIPSETQFLISSVDDVFLSSFSINRSFVLKWRAGRNGKNCREAGDPFVLIRFARLVVAAAVHPAPNVSSLLRSMICLFFRPLHLLLPFLRFLSFSTAIIVETIRRPPCLHIPVSRNLSSAKCVFCELWLSSMMSIPSYSCCFKRYLTTTQFAQLWNVYSDKIGIESLSHSFILTITLFSGSILPFLAYCFCLVVCPNNTTAPPYKLTLYHLFSVFQPCFSFFLFPLSSSALWLLPRVNPTASATPPTNSQRSRYRDPASFWMWEFGMRNRKWELSVWFRRVWVCRNSFTNRKSSLGSGTGCQVWFRFYGCGEERWNNHVSSATSGWSVWKSKKSEQPNTHHFLFSELPSLVETLGFTSFRLIFPRLSASSISRRTHEATKKAILQGPRHSHDRRMVVLRAHWLYVCSSREGFLQGTTASRYRRLVPDS